MYGPRKRSISTALPTPTDSVGDDLCIPPKRRIRPIIVCLRCKQQKLKCDLEKPCGACKRALLGNECVYNPFPSETTREQTKRRDVEHRRDGSSGNESTNVLENRVKQLEKQVSDLLAQPSHSQSPSIQSHSSPNATADDCWRSLLSSLPPLPGCEEFLEHFAQFDIMFGTTHMPSFRRRALDVLSRLPGHVDIREGSLLCGVFAALAIGARYTKKIPGKIEIPPETQHVDFDDLYNRVMLFIESKSGIDHICLDYVHALHLQVIRYLYDKGTSVAQSWIWMGKVLHAALYLQLEREPTELDPKIDPFEAEMRRREWWQIVISDGLLANNLGVKSMVSSIETTVRLPETMPDDSLDGSSRSFSADVMPERSFISAKIRFIPTLSKINELRRKYDNEPPVVKLDECLQELDSYTDSLEPHLRVDRVPGINEPPWVYPRACVISMGTDYLALQLLRPVMRSECPGIRTYASVNALLRARNLIITSKSYINHLLFRWSDGHALNLWTFGVKVFNSGVVMAFSLLSSHDAEHEYTIPRDERLGHLDTAIGALGMMTSEEVEGGLNFRALQGLRALRARAVADDQHQDQVDDEAVTDPYTERDVTMPDRPGRVVDQGTEKYDVDNQDWIFPPDLNWSDWESFESMLWQ